MPSKDGLIAAARAHVEILHPGDSPRRIEIVTEQGFEIILKIPAEGCHGNGYAATGTQRIPLACRGLSQTEDSILKALATAEPGAWVTAEELGKTTKQGKSTSFTGILTNLADAEVIESSPGRGYRLPVNQAGQHCKTG